jgi:hypothetical protein
MQITIDTTEEISDLDRQVLGLLAGGTFVLGEPGETFEEEVEEEPEPEPVKPAKKAAAKKAAAKKPEPEPEPMAEEPVEEDEEESEEDEEEIDEDEQSDEELLALAVKKATEMVAAGQAAQVREALDAAGANRVRELNADNVRDFFKALS